MNFMANEPPILNLGPPIRPLAHLDSRRPELLHKVRYPELYDCEQDSHLNRVSSVLNKYGVIKVGDQILTGFSKETIRKYEAGLINPTPDTPAINWDFIFPPKK